MKWKQWNEMKTTPLYCFHFTVLLYGFMLQKYNVLRSRDARLRRASLLRRIVYGASAKVYARFSVGVVSDRALPFLLGIWRPRKGLECPDTPFRFGNKHLRARKLLFFSGKCSRQFASPFSSPWTIIMNRANCRIVASMMRGSQQPEAIIGKYGCPQRRKIPEVEVIRQKNGSTGIFDQWIWIFRRFS